MACVWHSPIYCSIISSLMVYILFVQPNVSHAHIIFTGRHTGCITCDTSVTTNQNSQKLRITIWHQDHMHSTVSGRKSAFSKAYMNFCPNKTYFRLANSACCDLVTKRLFLQTHLTFTASSFTKASRIQALSRIAHHIQHLTFTFANSEATFLPPLVHPVTSDEISFLYMPYTHMALS